MVNEKLKKKSMTQMFNCFENVLFNRRLCQQECHMWYEKNVRKNVELNPLGKIPTDCLI